ncbi:pyrimidine utilization protein D [Klebsiella pneumoniae]|nr:pyrimidine utilization protein D [Klebsiella pneumoniae]
MRWWKSPASPISVPRHDEAQYCSGSVARRAGGGPQRRSGRGGGYWLAQRAALEEQYQLVSYDHNGTGENAGPLPADYSLATMAGELFSALQAAGIARFALVGHARGADWPAAGARSPRGGERLALVNGWLSLSPHTRRCFQVRERLLHAGGAQAWVEAQPLFLYPAEWMAARLPRLEAEDALAISHFQGKENLLKRLQALKQADFSRRASAIACPTLIISAADDLLVPASCSRVLQTAIPGSQLVEMPWGGHACNVTDADTFNTILRDGLSAMLPVAGRPDERRDKPHGLRDAVYPGPDPQRLAG